MSKTGGSLDFEPPCLVCMWLKIREQEHRVTSTDGIKVPRADILPHTDIFLRRYQAIQVMLHAPAGMWAALDSNRILVASNLLLRCRKSWADVSSSCFADVDPGVAAFLRSHLTYVEQFPQRIVLAGFRVLTSSRSTEETAGALTALLQLEAHKEADPLR